MVSQGDIFYVNFNPSKGHEQKNRRPAIALSNDLVAQTIALDLSARNVGNEDIIDEVSVNELYQIIERYKLLFSIDQLD